ncbi:MAG: hypothetical protein PHC28_15715 [Flavobacterium sp.]|uniref:hypothetical protein n=1 Tax=Flavobacterium sp. TaxID=239 RepID=UPI00260665EC|nr:hypothetical protein [Flavobacterium sp.]MDD5151901.1 hypothetical protein [Flavobacterium sp.]
MKKLLQTVENIAKGCFKYKLKYSIYHNTKEIRVQVRNREDENKIQYFIEKLQTDGLLVDRAWSEVLYIKNS